HKGKKIFYTLLSKFRAFAQNFSLMAELASVLFQKIFKFSDFIFKAFDDNFILPIFNMFHIEFGKSMVKAEDLNDDELVRFAREEFSKASLELMIGEGEAYDYGDDILGNKYELLWQALGLVQDVPEKIAGTSLALGPDLTSLLQIIADYRISEARATYYKVKGLKDKLGAISREENYSAKFVEKENNEFDEPLTSIFSYFKSLVLIHNEASS
ncbi:hypothetical protein ACJX0J_034168, partial [Zea mays]